MERLFFRTLNLPIEDRNTENDSTLDVETPYLNGGLFSPSQDDWVGEQLTFPNQFFIRLYEHLNNFNFTTDESTPEYEQVAIDPEMLGRVFESLLASQVESTGEQARKAKGAFYTPREVVAYICKESIRRYLIKPGVSNKYQSAVEMLLDKSDQDWANDGSNSLRDITPELRNEISSKLRVIKSFDPACGSGAFPLGLLQLLARLQLRLDPRLDGYKVKLDILQNNIFGSDIEPMAVEISRLRSWLSLIVEESGISALQPLPNLDFNFVCSNSLISLREADLFTNFDVQGKLDKLRQEYFRATRPKQKAEIQEKYLSLSQPDLIDERSNQLKTFQPFDSEAVAKFFDPEYMFGLVDGFDVIIGNPPYIGLKGHVNIFEPVKESSLGIRFFSGKMDYFYFFFHLALDLLKKDGVLGFITTNYFLSATYADKLVNDIKGRGTITNFLNFNEVKLFDSALGQHNLITIIRKGQSSETASVIVAGGKLRGKISDSELDLLLNGSHENASAVNVHQNELYAGGKIVLPAAQSEAINSILQKVAMQPTKLSDFFAVNQGIVSGGDKVSAAHISRLGWSPDLLGNGIFVLTKSELDDLHLNPHELEIVKPFYKNSDISPFRTNTEPSLFLIYAVEKLKNLETRPILRNHISQYMDAFVHQRDCAAPYLNLPRSVDFGGPKIVAPQRSKQNTFGFNEVDWFSSADVYFITGGRQPWSIKSLLGLLNSRLYFLWLYTNGKRKGEALELYQEPLANIPLPVIDDDSEAILARLEELSDLAISAEEGHMVLIMSEIDQLVCQLFNLDSKQINELLQWQPDKTKD